MTILKSWMIIGILVSASVCPALTLQEAIRTSLQNNPKTVANKKRVEAAEERFQAQKVSSMPGLTLISGTDGSVYHDYTGSSVTRSVSFGARTSYVLFDGGAQKLLEAKMEAELKAIEARYNSSNAQIPNTRGSIAKDVKDSFINLLELSERRQMLQFKQAILTIFLNYQGFAINENDDDRALVQQQLQDAKTSLQTLEGNYKLAEQEFSYNATVAPPPTAQMDTIDQVITSLVIPPNVDEAYQLALTFSPNIKLAEYDLESAKLGYQAEKAQLNSPRIILHGGVDQSASRIDGSSTRGLSASVGISLSYTIDAKNKHLERASVKNLEAAEDDLEGVKKETKFQIESTYPNLKNLQTQYGALQENLQHTSKDLDTIIHKIKTGQAVDIKTALGFLDVYMGYSDACLRIRISIANLRFNVQRTIGTLFDNLGKLP